MKWKTPIFYVLAVLLYSIFVSSAVYAIDSPGTTHLTVKFPGLSSVHTNVNLSDGIAGSISSSEIARANWKKNQATLKIPQGVYDVRIRHGKSEIILDDINCNQNTCLIDNILSTLTVRFPELSSVHTSVWIPDNVKGSISANDVTHENWKRDKAELTVLQGIYDVRIQKGASQIIIDNIDCRSATCNINDLTATLNVNFPGISSVHTGVGLADGIEGTIGEEVTSQNWKKNTAELIVLRGKYDVQVRKESASLIIDDVNCLARTCKIDNIVSTLTVDFPGISSAHTDVWLVDNISNSIGVDKISRNYWQTDQAVLTVLRGKYDVRIRKGSSFLVVDDVNCQSASCNVTDIVSSLTVKFPGMSSVHTGVWLPGANIGAEGEESVTHNDWKTDQAEMTVLRGSYDVRVRKGTSSKIIENVNCSSPTCIVSDIVSTLTVNFPGLSSVHTDIWLPGVLIGSEGVKRVTDKSWKDNFAELTILKGIYDVRVRKKASSLIKNDVDCRQNTCKIDDIVAVLSIDFPGLSSVHTDIWLPDNIPNQIGEEKVTRKSWKADRAELTVLRLSYDVRVRKGESEFIIDDVDCLSGSCNIKDIIATLTVRFPGLSSVHSDARVPDGIPNSATGGKVTRSNWKKQQTSMVVLRNTYDVRVRHAVTTIFDDVDCRIGVCDVLVLGDAQITLVDGDQNIILPDKTLIAYEKLPDGTLIKGMHGVTNSEGKVHFTLMGIEGGRTYVIQAKNPLNNRKNYYSPFINETGELLFLVTADGDTELDLIPPTISISSPLDGQFVSHNGFQIEGFASDNQQLESVVLNVSSGDLRTVVPVFLNDLDNSWSAMVNASLLMPDQLTTISAVATDRVRNTASISISVTPIVDVVGPTIDIISHMPLDTVPATGFLLSGTVTDQTDVKSLVVTLVDPELNTVFENIPVNFSSASGSWTVAVQNGQITENNIVKLSLIASDGSNNLTDVEIDLNVVAVDNTGMHMVRRITFGTSPSLQAEVDTIGADEFLNQQLSPGSIDNTIFDAQISAIVPTNLEALNSWSLMHMIYSKRQLSEVMTWFWDNHFNTDINTERRNANETLLSDTVAFELRENNEFRVNALGNFRQLLEISSKSPSMLIFLDSISNVVNDSNENYARELLELHTVGVDGGYSHTDIEAGAELFTGWHLVDGEFFFDSSAHNFDGQTVLGNDIASGGLAQGEQYLDILSAHPSTAKFICKKLITVFVNDLPPQSLIERCATTFGANVNSPDQIAVVLRLILSSPEFFDPENDRNKIKTPVEFVVGAMRNLEVQTNASGLAESIARMGIELYENPVPTGWSETGDDWINPSLLIERIKWVNQVIRDSEADGSNVNLLMFYTSNGYETTEGIVGFLLDLLLGNDYPDLARQQAIDLLNGVNGFDISDPEAEARLQELTGAVLSYPQYQFQ